MVARVVDVLDSMPGEPSFWRTLYDPSDAYNGGPDQYNCKNADCDAGSIGFLCGFEAAMGMLVDNPEGFMEAALQHKRYDETNPAAPGFLKSGEFIDSFYEAVAADRGKW